VRAGGPIARALRETLCLHLAVFANDTNAARIPRNQMLRLDLDIGRTPGAVMER
jgi:hypothetical protein